jgi:hypothetical protein
MRGGSLAAELACRWLKREGEPHLEMLGAQAIHRLISGRGSITGLSLVLGDGAVDEGDDK